MKATHAITHHSGHQGGLLTMQNALQSFNNSHKRFNNQSKTGYWIGYHFLIDYLGNIEQVRDLDEMGSHCSAQGMNKRSIGICLLGNFERDVLTEAQKQAWLGLLRKLRVEQGIENFTHHTTHAGNETLCPGKNIISNWNNYMNELNKIPQWFIDNKTDLWGKNKRIRVDQSNLTDSQVRELESLKKATMPADVDVSVFIMNEFNNNEKRAYNLALRDTTRFYDGYVNLLFQEPKIQNMSLEFRLGRLNGFTPERGLNVIIVPLAEVHRLSNGNNNGFMVVNQRTTVIGRELLLRDDSRARSHINGFTATLQHELMHWFARRLDFETGADLTHKYDFEFTLANYLPKLGWAMLHDKTFRNNSGL
jgi:hypothetical protein